MAEEKEAEVRALLDRMRAGDASAEGELYRLLHAELKKRASRLMRGQRPGHTLQATALLNEGWMRVFRRPVEFAGRGHFLAVSAKAMRHVLVDRARHKHSKKGGGGVAPVSLPQDARDARDPEITALDAALKDLSLLDARAARVVELKFFGGMTSAEIAEVVGVTAKTVDRDWSFARAWLHRALS